MALVVAAEAFISIFRTFVNMTLRAGTAFRTEAVEGECFADGGAGVHAYVGVAAVGVCATTT